MSGGRIGIYNPGLFQTNKDIQKTSKLATLKTAKEAEDFSKNHKGSELIEVKNGAYEVFSVTSADGSALKNQSFVDEKVKIDSGFTKEQQKDGIKRAYFVTSDNIVRVLNDKTTQVSSINQDYFNFKGTVTVIDKDGIDTNSKNDLSVNLKGNLKISKQVFEEVTNELSKMDFPVIGKINFKLETKDGNYKISASNFADINIQPSPDGNGLLCNVNAYGFGGYVADAIKQQLSAYGLNAENTESADKFILKPDFKNNNMIPKFKVGNMELNFEEVDQAKSKSTFAMDNTGIVANLDITGIGSSLASSKTKAVAEDKADIISAELNSSIKTDFSSFATITNGKIQTNIRLDEKEGLKKQLEGFGQKNVSLTGDITVSDINTQIGVSANGDAEVTGKTEVRIQSNQITFEDGNNKTKVQISGAKGDLGYQSTKEGGFSANLAGGEISSIFEKPDFSASIKNLKADGSFTYIPKNKEKPETYRITGASIESGTIKLKSGNDSYSLEKVALKNANLDITPSNAGFSISSKSGIRASVNNLKIGSDVNISGTVIGSISYDPKTGTTINSDAKNLRGKIGLFNLSDFEAKGKVQLDPSGNLSLTDVSRFDFKLDPKGNGDALLNNLGASGKNLVIKKEGELITVSSPEAKISNLSIFQGKTKNTPKTDFIKNISYSGKVDINTTNYSIKVHAGSTLHSGEISGIKFNQFKADKDIIINNSNESLKIESPMSFSGEIKADGLSIKDVKFTAQNSSNTGGSIVLDKKTETISVDGQAEFKISVKEEVKGNKQLANDNNYGSLSVSGKVDVKKDGSKAIIECHEGSKLNLKSEGIDLKGLEFVGKVIIDGTKVIIQKPDGQPDFTLKGNFNGKDINLKATGDLIFDSQKGETSITANSVQINGNVGGIAIESKGEGINGKVSFSKDSKLPLVEGLNLNLEVDGIKLEAKGSIEQKTDGGYVINLPSNIEGGSGKFAKLIDKISNEFTTTPEQKQKLAELKKLFSEIDLNKVKFDDLKVELSNDLKSFKIKGSSSNLDLNIHDIPERNITIKNTPPDKVSFELTEKGEVTLTSSGTKIEGEFNGVAIKDFSLKGGIKYTPSKGGVSETISLITPDVQGKVGFNGIDVKGDLIFKDTQGSPLIRHLEIKADADVNITRKGKDIELEGNNMKLDGMFSEFKLKSLPLDDNQSTFASGKITLKDDGHFDFSKLSFRFELDGMQIYNKDGSLSRKSVVDKKTGKEERVYELKLSGDVNAQIKSLLKFLDKASNDKVMPKVVRDSTESTLKSIEQVINSGKTNGKYNLSLNLNQDFGIKSFNLDTSASIKNAELNLSTIGLGDKKLKIDNLNVTANSSIIDSQSNFHIKDGTVDFEFNDAVKNQLKTVISNTIKQMVIDSVPKILGAEKEKIDINVDIAPNGNISVSGKVNDINIINHVDLGAELSFEGSKIHLDVDKVKTGNFIGAFVQLLYRPATKEGVVEEAAKAFAKEGLVVDYNGKAGLTIDLESTISKATDNAIKITDFKIENNQVLIKYDAEYVVEKGYNQAKIDGFVNTFNKLASINNTPENSRAKMTIDLKDLSPLELSMSMEKINLSPEKIKNMSLVTTNNVNNLAIDIMKKLYENKDVANNKDALLRIISTMNKSNRNTLKLFIDFMRTADKTSAKDIIMAVNNKVLELR